MQIFFALLYHLPFVLWLGLSQLMHRMWAVLYAGIFPSLVAPLVWIMAVQAMGPNRTSVFEPHANFYCGDCLFWLAEQWSIYHTIGTVLAHIGCHTGAKENHYWCWKNELKRDVNSI